MNPLNEKSLAEQSVIDWFKELGYECKFGAEISPGGLQPERALHDALLEKII